MNQTTLNLLDDIASLLSSLQCELSCITSTDTGCDPTAHIRDGIKELRAKISEQRRDFLGRTAFYESTATAHPKALQLRRLASPKNKTGKSA